MFNLLAVAWPRWDPGCHSLSGSELFDVWRWFVMPPILLRIKRERSLRPAKLSAFVKLCHAQCAYISPDEFERIHLRVGRADGLSLRRRTASGNIPEGAELLQEGSLRHIRDPEEDGSLNIPMSWSTANAENPVVTLFWLPPGTQASLECEHLEGLRDVRRVEVKNYYLKYVWSVVFAAGYLFIPRVVSGMHGNGFFPQTMSFVGCILLMVNSLIRIAALISFWMSWRHALLRYKTSYGLVSLFDMGCLRALQQLSPRHQMMSVAVTRLRRTERYVLDDHVQEADSSLVFLRREVGFHDVDAISAWWHSRELLQLHLLYDRVNVEFFLTVAVVLWIVALFLSVLSAFRAAHVTAYSYQVLWIMFCLTFPLSSCIRVAERINARINDHADVLLEAQLLLSPNASVDSESERIQWRNDHILRNDMLGLMQRLEQQIRQSNELPQKFFGFVPNGKLVLKYIFGVVLQLAMVLCKNAAVQDWVKHHWLHWIGTSTQTMETQ